MAYKKFNPKKKYYKKKMKKKMTSTDLVKKVAQIERQMRIAYSTQYLYGAYELESQVVTPYTYLNLCNYSTLAPCFGTAASDINTSNKWLHKNFKFDIYVSSNDEMSDVILTLFVVTMTKNSDIYNKSTGALSSLVATTDYVNTSIVAADYAQTWLSPKMFKVHWSKRLIVGNNSVAALGPSGTGETVTVNSYRKVLKFKTDDIIYNPEGNVYDLPCNQDPTQQYYLLAFNNNSGADFEYPFIHINSLHTINVPN